MSIARNGHPLTPLAPFGALMQSIPWNYRLHHSRKLWLFTSNAFGPEVNALLHVMFVYPKDNRDPCQARVFVAICSSSYLSHVRHRSISVACRPETAQSVNAMWAAYCKFFEQQSEQRLFNKRCDGNERRLRVFASSKANGLSFGKNKYRAAISDIILEMGLLSRDLCDLCQSVNITIHTEGPILWARGSHIVAIEASCVPYSRKIA